MKKVIRMVFIEIVPLLFVCLMWYSAVTKLMDYNLSREQMAMMPLLRPMAHIVVWALPLTEVAIAMLLFFPPVRMKGLYAFTGLMLVFTIYVAFMMTSYKELPCSCGGLLETLSWKGHLIFNIVTVLLGSLVIVLYKRKDSANWVSFGRSRYITG